MHLEEARVDCYLNTQLQSKYELDVKERVESTHLFDLNFNLKAASSAKSILG